ncbi:hypothetical protein MMC15_007807 [Xylographa vitiligo]|nr:hypothetical protein [Xylographa vitiligo]
MISDNDLYTLAIFLGSLSMLLIVLYHFLEVNAIEDDATTTAPIDTVGVPSDKLSSKARGKDAIVVDELREYSCQWDLKGAYQLRDRPGNGESYQEK